MFNIGYSRVIDKFILMVLGITCYHESGVERVRGG